MAGVPVVLLEREEDPLEIDLREDKRGVSSSLRSSCQSTGVSLLRSRSSGVCGTAVLSGDALSPEMIQSIALVDAAAASARPAVRVLLLMLLMQLLL